MDKFDLAKTLISERLIKQYFDCEKSKILKTSRGRELMTLCPFRGDTKPGSFFVNLDTGMWVELSSNAGEQKGDFIKLVQLAYSLKPVDAALKIIKDTGGIVPEKMHVDPEKPKPKAILPIPEVALKKLDKHLNSNWIVKNYGVAKYGTEYRNKKGELWLCVVRHILENDKNDVPYKYCQDQKWHAGNAISKNRPLLGIEKLTENNKIPILIVEGEKCQKIKVDGYISISWCGGTNQCKLSNWKELKNFKNITFWPDCDHKTDKQKNRYPDHQQPGLKTALFVKDKLPQTKILNIYHEDHPDTWDIANAEAEGLDLIKFIKNTPEYTIPTVEDVIDDLDDNLPFKFLGFDDGRHFFIPAGSNIVKKVPFGQISKTKLLELAPLSFWQMAFPQKTGFDIDSAMDYIIRESESKGFFMPDNVRGAGVWFDQERIVVNTGKDLHDCNNKKINLKQNEFHYVASDKKMGNLSGDVSTLDEGHELIKLFLTQGFEKDIEAITVLGWSLIASFGGILKWRPHIWITGPVQTGKSFLLENLIHPLTGPFAFVGSGKDTAAGLYRTLWKDPCPVIKDEMEPGKDKDTKKRIDEILDTARNASSDFSSYKTIANMHGGVDRFCIRSMFCLSSVVPYFSGDALESRILICRLKNLRMVKEKKTKTIEMLKSGLFKDTGRFRRKIFKNLKNVIANIKISNDVIKEILGDDRKADNYAPLFSAFFSIIHDGILDKKKISPWMENLFSDTEEFKGDTDEDKLLKVIFDYWVKVDHVKNLTIAELIMENEDRTNSNDNMLKMHQHGIKFYNKDNTTYIAVARQHSQIRKILADTIYSGRYEEVLKRHEFVVDNSPSIRFAGISSRTILLDWGKVKKKYFQDPEIDTADLYNTF